MKTVKAFILFSGIVLSGCTYSSNFDCPIGEGNQCASISENVKKIESGAYGEQQTTVQEARQFFFDEEF